MIAVTTEMVSVGVPVAVVFGLLETIKLLASRVRRNGNGKIDAQTFNALLEASKTGRQVAELNRWTDRGEQTKPVVAELKVLSRIMQDVATRLDKHNTDIESWLRNGCPVAPEMRAILDEMRRGILKTS